MPTKHVDPKKYPFKFKPQTLKKPLQFRFAFGNLIPFSIRFCHIISRSLMHNTRRFSHLSALFTLLACGAASAQVLQAFPAVPSDAPPGPYGPRAAVYSYDDGISEFDFAYSDANPDGEVLVMHRFTVIPGAEDITQVMAAFGQGSNGLSVKMCVWEDPNDDGLAGDVILIGQTTITVANAGTNTFNVAAINTSQRPSGSFFVGYVYPLEAGTFRTLIAADISTTYITGRTITGRSVGPMNLGTLAGLAFGPMDWFAAGGSGTVMIRATGAGDSVTYQGQLKEAGLPASGPVDLIFKLFTSESGGTQLGSNYLFSNITLEDGRFTVGLPSDEFITANAPIWVQVEVSPQGANTYTALSPRQRITPAPEAIKASFAQRAGAVDWNDIENKPPLNPDADITAVIAGPGLLGGATSGEATLRVSFAGNGTSASASRSDHTHLANEIVNGTLPQAVLPSSVALLNVAQTFTSSKTFAAGTVIGSAVTPDALLHIHDSSAGGMTASASSTLVLERNNTNYLSIITPDANERGVVFGSPISNLHGGIYYTNSGGLTFRTNLNQTRMSIDPAGRVGIGRNPSTNILEVQGNASKTSSGSWLSNSDGRIKTNILGINNALATLNKVRLVSFDYSPHYLAAHPEIQNRRYLNVIAQEFAQVFPDHVQSSGERLPDGSEILQVDIHPLTIYSAAAIQELDAKLKRMESTLASMNATLKTLEDKNRKLEEKVNHLERLVPGAK